MNFLLFSWIAVADLRVATVASIIRISFFSNTVFGKAEFSNVR